MSETLTNTPINQSETNAAAIEQMHSDYEALQKAENPSLIDESFDDAIALQARDIGKRLTEEPVAETPKTNHIVRNTLFATGAVATATAGMLGLNAMGNETESVPTFSEETTTYTVQPNDGLEKIVNTIPGIDTVDKRDAEHYVSVDPANIDVLKDGLHPGEQLVVPVSINGVESSNE